MTLEREVEATALGRSVGAGTATSESYDLGEDGTQGRGATIADALLDAPVEGLEVLELLEVVDEVRRAVLALRAGGAA